MISIYNRIIGSANSHALLGNSLVTLLLFIIMLLLIEVPQDIHIGRKGQIAIKELDGMRYPLLNIKSVVSQYKIDGNIDNAKSEIERLGEGAKSCIEHYKHAADYSESLSRNVAEFSAAYLKWFDAENVYLAWHSENQITQPHNHYVNEYHLVESLYENDAMFLSVMTLLGDGETTIHKDIAKGQKAYVLLQWAGALLIIYFFTIIFLFQRNSNRQHVVREKNLEMTLRSIGEAVIATNIHGCITCMNPEAERLTGWQFKDAKNCELTEVFKVVNAYSGMPVSDMVERVQQEKGIVVLAEDSMLIASDGKRYQIYENGAPIYDDANKIIGVVLVFRDITQEHELKTCLNEKALRLRRVVDSSMDAVIVIDEKGQIDEWNPAAESMFGWSYAEARKRLVHDLIIPEEFRERHLQGIRQLFMSNNTSFMAKRIESLALHRDGHTFPIDLAMTSIQTENGWVFNAYIRDLTDQKNKEKLIDKKSGLLNEAMSIAKLGYWELDLLQGKLEWSDEIYEMFDMDPCQTKISYALFLNVIHPEDRAKVGSAYSESLKNRTPYNIIHRIVTKDGIRIVNGQCKTNYDETGKPVRSLGLIQDITEKGKADLLLACMGCIFEHSWNEIYTFDAGTLNFVEVSDGACQNLGYSIDELRQLTPLDIKPEFTTEQFEALVGPLRRGEEKTVTFETEHQRKDGSLYSVEIRLQLSSVEMRPVFIAIIQDISERKKAESRIEHLA